MSFLLPGKKISDLIIFGFGSLWRICTVFLGSLVGWVFGGTVIIFYMNSGDICGGGLV